MNIFFLLAPSSFSTIMTAKAGGNSRFVVNFNCYDKAVDILTEQSRPERTWNTRKYSNQSWKMGHDAGEYSKRLERDRVALNRALKDSADYVECVGTEAIKKIFLKIQQIITAIYKHKIFPLKDPEDLEEQEAAFRAYPGDILRDKEALDLSETAIAKMIDKNSSQSVERQRHDLALDLFRKLLILTDSEFAEPERGSAGVADMSVIQWQDWVKEETARREQIEKDDIARANGKKKDSKKRKRGGDEGDGEDDDKEDSSESDQELTDHQRRKGKQKANGGAVGPDYVEPGDKAMMDIGAAQLAKGQAAVLRAKHEVFTAQKEERERGLVKAAKLLVPGKATDFDALERYLDDAGIDLSDDPDDIALGLAELSKEGRNSVAGFLKDTAGRAFLRLTEPPVAPMDPLEQTPGEKAAQQAATVTVEKPPMDK